MRCFVILNTAAIIASTIAPSLIPPVLRWVSGEKRQCNKQRKERSVAPLFLPHSSLFVTTVLQSSVFVLPHHKETAVPNLGMH